MCLLCQKFRKKLGVNHSTAPEMEGDFITFVVKIVLFLLKINKKEAGDEPHFKKHTLNLGTYSKTY